MHHINNRKRPFAVTELYSVVSDLPHGSSWTLGVYSDDLMTGVQKPQLNSVVVGCKVVRLLIRIIWSLNTGPVPEIVVKHFAGKHQGQC